MPRPKRKLGKGYHQAEQSDASSRDEQHRSKHARDVQCKARLQDLVGEPGAPATGGKSTLLKLIADLLEPSDGRILWWRGYGDKLGSDGRRIAFVFQDPTPAMRARGAIRIVDGAC